MHETCEQRRAREYGIGRPADVGPAKPFVPNMPQDNYRSLPKPPNARDYTDPIVFARDFADYERLLSAVASGTRAPR